MMIDTKLNLNSSPIYNSINQHSEIMKPEINNSGSGVSISFQSDSKRYSVKASLPIIPSVLPNYNISGICVRIMGVSCYQYLFIPLNDPNHAYLVSQPPLHSVGVPLPNDYSPNSIFYSSIVTLSTNIFGPYINNLCSLISSKPQTQPLPTPNFDLPTASSQPIPATNLQSTINSSQEITGQISLHRNLSSNSISSSLPVTSTSSGRKTLSRQQSLTHNESQVKSQPRLNLTIKPSNTDTHQCSVQTPYSLDTRLLHNSFSTDLHPNSIQQNSLPFSKSFTKFNDDSNPSQISEPDVKNSYISDLIDSFELTDNLPQQKQKLSKYNYRAKHRILEIWESRIQRTTDCEYEHPAEAWMAALESPHPKLSGEETTLYHHYKTEDTVSYIPNFWPSRSWDQEEYILSDEKSQFLKEKIYALDHQPFPKKKGCKEERKSPKGRKQYEKKQTSRNFVNNSLIVLPLSDFETENEFITDIEDF